MAAEHDDDITVVGVDADDTLWSNMPFFLETEERFCRLLDRFGDAESVAGELAATEAANIPLYGYGVKGHTLSMLETAVRLAGRQLDPAVVAAILELGKTLLEHPVEVLDGVAEALAELGEGRRLVLVTKGDPLHQERKLDKSGLAGFFHHIEIVSDKTAEGYSRLIRHLDVAPARFAMIGDSVKSDILPVLAIGGYAVHVPFPVTWAHEEAEAPIGHAGFFRIGSIGEAPGLPLFRRR